MTPKLRYSLYVLTAALISGSAWILTEITLNFYEVSPVLIATGTNLIGGLLLLTITIKPGSRPFQTWQRRDWVSVGVVALTIYTLGFLFIFNAIELIGTGKAVLLARLDTLFVVVLAVIFLKEPFSSRHWLAGGLAIGGAVLINFDPNALELTFGWGEMFSILAPLSIAIGIINFKSLVDRVDVGQVTGVAMFGGGLMLLPFAIFDNTFATLLSVGGLLIITMGIVRGFAWYIYNIAQKHIGASLCAIIFLASGFFAILFQVTFAAWFPALGLQPPRNLGTAIMGGILIATGIIILQLEKKEQTAAE